MVLKSGQIPSDTRLIEEFLRYGELDYFEVKAGKSIGFAKYSSAQDARAALQLDGVFVGECLIKVEIAQPFTSGSGQKRPRA